MLYEGYPNIKREFSEGDSITCIDMHVNPFIKQPRCSKHIYKPDQVLENSNIKQTKSQLYNKASVLFHS